MNIKFHKNFRLFFIAGVLGIAICGGGYYLVSESGVVSTSSTIGEKKNGLSADEIRNSDCEIGEVIKFGSYEQDGNQNNGYEPIEWIVLDKQDDYYLLISKYALEYKTFDEDRDALWVDCDLRKWLNGEFYEEAFGEEQKNLLLSTHLENSSELTEMPDTEDRVFLLSEEEIYTYFSSDESRVCTVTPYAQSEIAKWYDEEGDGCCWWLRTVCDPRVCEVGYDGREEVPTFPDNEGVAVRPVIRVDRNNQGDNK